MRLCLSDVRISSDFNAIPLERFISLNRMAAVEVTDRSANCNGTIHTCVQSALKIRKAWSNYVSEKCFHDVQTESPTCRFTFEKPATRR